MRHARSDYEDRIVDLEGVIPDDEPVFLLRGQDRHAPPTLEAYAASVEPFNPEIAAISRRWAERMREFQARRMVKEPDMPEDALDLSDCALDDGASDDVSSGSADSR